MKKVLIVLMCMILLISCSDEKGVDIGDSTVSVSFKETTDKPQDIINTVEGMYIVLDSIVRTMKYYEMPYSDEPLFMWRVITMILNNSDEVQAAEELVIDYVSACFNNTTTIPELAGGVEYNPESLTYTVPQLNDYVYDNYTVEVGDVLDNGDGTYTAYINYVVNDDDSIGEQYIFTLKINTRTALSSTYIDSSKYMMYTVVLVTVLEL